MDAEALKDVKLFEGVDQATLERCAALFQETEILAGSGLTREGDFSYKFFVVLDGEVEVLRDFDHVANLGPGDFFGEMGVVADARRNARVVALTRCRLAWMMGWDFQTMTAEHPEIAARIQAVVDERMASLPSDQT